LKPKKRSLLTVNEHFEAKNNAVIEFSGYYLIMIFEGMWKGVVLGFSAIGFVGLMFVFVFSKIMPGIDDEGEEIRPDEM
jgi:hypothetical protein